MKDLMELPIKVLEHMEAEELMLIKGGRSCDTVKPTNNADGTCSGTNNGSGRCSGTNNGSGKCG